MISTSPIVAMAADSENRNTNSSCKAEGLEYSSFLYSTASEHPELLRRKKWFPVNCIYTEAELEKIFVNL